MSEQAEMDGDNSADDAMLAGALVSIQLEVDPETNVLSAVIADSATPVVVDLAYLNHLLAEHGYQDFYIESDALGELLGKVSEGDRGKFALGERRDAVLRIAVSEDAMRVSASSEPAYGGQSLTQERVECTLVEANIDPRAWHRDRIEEVLAQDCVTDFEIASGTPPEAGTDSQFVQLVHGIDTHGPAETDLGNVDQYEVNDFIVVEPGTQLMRRDPATPGVDGFDVHATTLTAVPGKHTSYAKNLAGVMQDETDDNILVATGKGHPVALANGVRLDDVLKLPSVDMRTGHVSFDGSVFISGDVTAGVEINATGDITVKGTVEHAKLRAGGCIVVGGGVINPSSQRDDEEELAIRLEAGGDIQAKFVSGALLKADGHVVVKEYLGFCRTEAGDQVSVGQGGGKGHVFGGTCHGRNGVLANQLGSNSSASTLVIAGHAAIPSEDQSELTSDLIDLDEQRKKIEFLISKMFCDLPPTPDPDNPGAESADAETCDKLRKTLESLQAEEDELRRAMANLQAQLVEDSSAEVGVFAAKVIRAGVVLRIDGVDRGFDNRDTGGTFQQQGGAVVRTG